MPSETLAASIWRGSRGSISPEGGNFPASGAFAKGVETASLDIDRLCLNEGVHTSNAPVVPLLPEAAGVPGEKKENSWKKMGPSGNHTENQPQSGKSGPPARDAEAALVRRLKQGEEAAFHELVDRFGEQLFRVAYSMVGNAADGEDVVAETYSAAFAGIGRFRGESSLKTWLMQILVRQCARLKRGRGRRWMIGIEKTEATVRDSAEAADSRMDVVAMLQTLSAEHREVIVLRELQSMSYEEISEALKIPTGTVESRLHRARHELKAKFGNEL
jgi:RNA polymerase sigma-70 factor, ECF subfamily